jgi:hypothetical protein
MEENMEECRKGIDFVITGDDFIDCLNGLRSVIGIFDSDDKFIKRVVSSLALSVGLA